MRSNWSSILDLLAKPVSITPKRCCSVLARLRHSPQADTLLVLTDDYLHPQLRAINDERLGNGSALVALQARWACTVDWPLYRAWSDWLLGLHGAADALKSAG